MGYFLTPFLQACAVEVGNGKTSQPGTLPVLHTHCFRLPSIIWQFLWNFFFGPYLLWKIRMIRDIYHWRLQTMMSIVAGFVTASPVSGLKLMSTAFPEHLCGSLEYTVMVLAPSTSTGFRLCGEFCVQFSTANTFLPNTSRFVPGLIVMEITTIVFPIIQIRKYNRAVRETSQALAAFDSKRLNSTASSVDGSGSFTTRSTRSKRSGKMYTMESLDECLGTNYDSLQIYASCMELNGENIVFLVRVLDFQKQWNSMFSQSLDLSRARMAMFRIALSIYVTLVHSGTATYPINVESNIYNHLEVIFGKATELVASERRHSILSSSTSKVTPWEEPSEAVTPLQEPVHEVIQMKAMLSTPPTRKSNSNDSCEHIISFSDDADPHDPLATFLVPITFDKHVFDAAFNSIRYMVWTETWQRYMQWNRSKEHHI